VSDLFGVNRTAGRRAADARRGWAETWTVVRTVLIVLGALGALRVVYQLGTIILPVVFSLLFAYLITPLVAFLGDIDSHITRDHRRVSLSAARAIEATTAVRRYRAARSDGSWRTGGWKGYGGDR
jgi:hypothetical protein